jgi:riboflavin biosynthesis pyrimidine reductase
MSAQPAQSPQSSPNEGPITSKMRPKVICHMASSVDGRLLVDRWSKPASGTDENAVREHYESVASRFQSDGWIVGRVTMEEIVQGPARTVKAPGGGLRGTYVADRAGRKIAVAIDPKGKLHYGQDNAGGDHIVAVLGEQVSDDYLAELREDGVSYLFAGPTGQDLRLALETLGESFGAKTLLLEGGGRINGAFLKARLIDEISLLVYPGIDGLSGMPSIFEYEGAPDEMPAAAQSLRHSGTETLSDGVVWLRYRVEESK